MHILIGDLKAPSFLYGTACKETITKSCVSSALKEGFRGFDSANQRKYFDESSLGEALAEAYQDKIVVREDLFLQTKYVSDEYQDGYADDIKELPLETRINQSLQTSLLRLNTKYIDSFMINCEQKNSELSESELAEWKGLENLHSNGQIRFLGVCNITYSKLLALWQFASIKPKFIQNQCSARNGWDRDLRKFCTDNQIGYQGYSLLPTNRHIFDQTRFQEIMKRNNCSAPQLVFRFATQCGIISLTGTRTPLHMKENLDIEWLRLSDHDMYLMEYI